MLVAFILKLKTRKINEKNISLEGIKKRIIDFKKFELILYGYGFESSNSFESELIFKLYEGDLNSRNLIITIKNERLKIEADWLGSFPVYYDEISQEISSHWGLLNLEAHESDNVGRYILKKYSYIPNQRTILKGIKRLLAEEIIYWQNELIKIDKNKKAISLNKNESSVENIIFLINETLNNDCKGKNAIVPLSSGYDSRLLLNCLIKGNGVFKIKTATYALSKEIENCFEAVVARAVSLKCNVDWSCFFLDDFRIFEELIIERNGGFSHINGDYYEKFANLCLKSICSKQNETVVCSGIVGDAWSGKIKIPNINDPLIYKKVLYSHGIKLYNFLFSKSERDCSEIAESELKEFYSNRIVNNQDYLIELVRGKIGLLSFLCYAFERHGVKVSSPFLNRSVVEKILNLNPQLLNNRQWEKQYFSIQKIGDEALPILSFKVNNLAIEEGSKKRLLDSQFKFIYKDLSVIGKILFRLIQSEVFRKCESKWQRVKILDYILRKMGYIRSDVLLSILKVTSR